MSRSSDYRSQPINETKLSEVLFDYWKEAALINMLKLHQIIFRIQERYDPNDKSVPWKSVRDGVLNGFFPSSEDSYTRTAYASILGSYFARGSRRMKKPKNKKPPSKKASLPERKKIVKPVPVHTEHNGQLVWVWDL